MAHTDGIRVAPTLTLPGAATIDPAGTQAYSEALNAPIFSTGQTYRGHLRTINQDTAGLAGTALATSTTLTDVSNAAATLSANSLSIGSVIRVTAAGTFSNTGTPTLLLGVYLNAVAGTALAVSGAITTITAATSWQWRLEWTGIVRTIGASGTVWGQGRLEMPASLTAFQAAYCLPAATNAVVTIDTTAVNTLTIGAQWGTSSSSNTLTVQQFAVERG